MIAVEILSPREEIDSKITIYLRGGAAEVWVVNPKLRTLVIYTSETRVEVTGDHRSEAIGQNVAVADIFG